MKKILVTGATGLIGSQLCRQLEELDYPLKIITRQKSSAKKLNLKAEVIEWDLNTVELPAAYFQDVFCLIHLAGESIDGRWTVKKKVAILQSREQSSKNILAQMPKSVEKVFSVSGQGIYVDQADKWLDEKATIGHDFLAEVCKKWEAPFIQLLASSTSQVAIFRLGIVVSQKGGALKKMLPVFRNNLGAALGSGSQWMSWIHLDDVCQLFIEALKKPEYRGIINATTENPVTNNEWTKALCSTLNTLQLPAVPRFVLKTLFGEMAVILLSSTRVQPRKLQELKFKYKFNHLSEALQQELQQV